MPEPESRAYGQTLSFGDVGSMSGLPKADVTGDL
jgi:hypothetical protein